MTQNFLGTGWGFPVSVDSQGRIVRVDEVDAINRSIQLILGTAKGERLMRPDFGSDLFNFLFQPLSAINKGRMATTVKSALQKWEPRIRVMDVAVSSNPRNAATALISVEYKVRSNNTKANYVYPFYLRGPEQ